MNKMESVTEKQILNQTAKHLTLQALITKPEKIQAQAKQIFGQKLIDCSRVWASYIEHVASTLKSQKSVQTVFGTFLSLTLFHPSQDFIKLYQLNSKEPPSQTPADTIISYLDIAKAANVDPDFAKLSIDTFASLFGKSVAAKIDFNFGVMEIQQKKIRFNLPSQPVCNQNDYYDVSAALSSGQGKCFSSKSLHRLKSQTQPSSKRNSPKQSLQRSQSSEIDSVFKCSPQTLVNHLAVQRCWSQLDQLTSEKQLYLQQFEKRIKDNYQMTLQERINKRNQQKFIQRQLSDAIMSRSRHIQQQQQLEMQPYCTSAHPGVSDEESRQIRRRIRENESANKTFIYQQIIQKQKMKGIMKSTRFEGELCSNLGREQRRIREAHEEELKRSAQVKGLLETWELQRKIAERQKALNYL